MRRKVKTGRCWCRCKNRCVWAGDMVWSGFLGNLSKYVIQMVKQWDAGLVTVEVEQL